MSGDAYRQCSAAELRAAIRAGSWRGPTPGLAQGYAQANVLILPADYAADFAAFCRANPQPCPLLDQTAPGDPCPRWAAPTADLRTDVPRYRVFVDGQPTGEEPASIAHLWRDDFVGFLLGCSFTFEHALLAAGLEVRHVRLGRNVPMYRTTRPCTPAGPFAGPLVVSMRPYCAEQMEQVRAITAAYPRMHGPPVHAGDPAALGIADLARPDFGEAVPVAADEVPVFWACGVTPQLALAAARPPLAIAHAPGYMFVLDRRDEEFYQP